VEENYVALAVHALKSEIKLMPLKKKKNSRMTYRKAVS